VCVCVCLNVCACLLDGLYIASCRSESGQYLVPHASEPMLKHGWKILFKLACFISQYILRN
jgi:hypothetical protein